MSDKPRTAYQLQVLARDGWTTIKESANKSSLMKRLATMGEPEAVAEYGLCAARIVTAKGKVIARLPETGPMEGVELSEAQCEALAIEVGDKVVVDEVQKADEERAAREKAQAEKAEKAAAKATASSAPKAGAKPARPGVDSRGFRLFPGDVVAIKARDNETGEVEVVDIEANLVRVVLATETAIVPARGVRIVTREGGAPIEPITAEGATLKPGDRVRSLFSPMTGEVDAVKPNGEVMVKRDQGGRTNYPAPALAVVSAAVAA